MATKKTPIVEDAYEADLPAKEEAVAAPVIQHRTTLPKMPPLSFADAAGASALNRIRAVAEGVVYSRDPNAAASALIVLGQQQLPVTASPALRQYLAEVTDYLQGKVAS